jgi:two-component system sensor histidine kinase/response regulator
MVRAAPGRYTAVLMDMQMPEMDGLTATRVLRGDRHDLPIIAMTANAMKADLDACLDAGMNDHITKPIDRKTLVETLRRWLPEPVRPRESDWSVPSAQPAGDAFPRLEGIDLSGSLKRLGLEFESFKRMLIRFADGHGAALDALRAAVAADDSAAVARHAHAIAGAAGNLGADDVRAAAKALERAGREGSKDIGKLFDHLEDRAAVVLRSIETLRTADVPVRTSPEQRSVPVAARFALERLQAALGDFDVSAATSALADLDATPMAGATSELARLRNHVDSYEYEEARLLATRLLEEIDHKVS